MTVGKLWMLLMIARRLAKGLLIAALLAAVASLPAAAPQVVFAAGNAAPQEIWLSGVDPVVWHRQKGHSQPNDFMDMFDEHASWQQAASRAPSRFRPDRRK